MKRRSRSPSSLQAFGEALGQEWLGTPGAQEPPWALVRLRVGGWSRSVSLTAGPATVYVQLLLARKPGGC